MLASHDAHEHAGHGHDSSSGFWLDVASILTDPAHVVAELIFFVILDVAILGFGLSVINKRRIAREHRVIDAEHGFVHDPIDPIIVNPARRSDIVLHREGQA